MQVTDQLYASRRFTLGEKHPVYKSLDGPQNQSGYGGEENNFFSCKESNPGRPVLKPTLYTLNIPRVKAITTECQ